MEPIILRDPEELSQKVADWMVQYIQTRLEHQDRFTLALSGGQTPTRLYQLLASAAYRDRIPWQKLHFFWGDERYVPFDDQRNNARMAFENLLYHVPVLSDQVHIIRTDIDPGDAATEYEKLLHRYFDKQDFSFDLVLLGLGDNAHTLSLFPGYENIYEKEKWVISFYLAAQEMTRITLTTPVINRSASIVFLVCGADKAMPVYKVLYGHHEPDLYPAQLIQPYQGKTYWFIDEAAARELDSIIE